MWGAQCDAVRGFGVGEWNWAPGDEGQSHCPRDSPSGLRVRRSSSLPFRPFSSSVFVPPPGRVEGLQRLSEVWELGRRSVFPALPGG